MNDHRKENGHVYTLFLFLVPQFHSLWTAVLWNKRTAGHSHVCTVENGKGMIPTIDKDHGPWCFTEKDPYAGPKLIRNLFTSTRSRNPNLFFLNFQAISVYKISPSPLHCFLNEWEKVIASLRGSVRKDFVCGHEFESRLKWTFSNFPYDLMTLKVIIELWLSGSVQEVRFSFEVKSKKGPLILTSLLNQRRNYYYYYLSKIPNCSIGAVQLAHTFIITTILIQLQFN